MEENNVNFKKLAKDIDVSDKYLELILGKHSDVSLFELKTLYDKFKHHKGGTLIYSKWKKEALKKAKHIRSIHEATSIHNNSPLKSKGQKIAIKKWCKYSRLKISKAKNFTEAQQAYILAPASTKEKSRAFLKWIRLAKTTAEIKLVFKESKNREKKLITLEKWYKLAKGKNEIKELYENAIGTSYELKALRKLSRSYIS
ncbi:MAG: hypothetical protein PF488_00140 [Patescibacteria group bacterium]|jgi:hypothetical protein|nr:hypothetical protein [Patescibacteria group bacterium]